MGCRAHPGCRLCSLMNRQSTNATKFIDCEETFQVDNESAVQTCRKSAVVRGRSSPQPEPQRTSYAPAGCVVDHIACPGRIAVPLHLPRACRSAQRPPRNGCAHYQQEGRHRRGLRPRRIQISRTSGRARTMTMMTRLGAPGRHSIIAAIAGRRRRCSRLQERITKLWAGWMPHSTCLRRAI